MTSYIVGRLYIVLQKLLSDVVAEWTKALDLGSSLSWRGL